LACIIWLAILTGFGLDIARKAASGALAFPLIIHLHASAYVGAAYGFSRTRRR
jgi:hypothetical protein